MKVGIITYQVGHKKTLDVALKLMTRGHYITLYAFPFVKREPRPSTCYQERPSQILDFDVEKFCRSYLIHYVPMQGWDDKYAEDFCDSDVYLHCTAKIVPPKFIDDRIILNAHPGLLPENRGVDAFKWALVKGWPLGVTLHRIDEKIDRGTILHRANVPILSDDTLRTVAWRAYEFECDLLANFDAHLYRLKDGWQVGDKHPISHEKIPQAVDDVLPELFLRRRDEMMGANASY